MGIKSFLAKKNKDYHPVIAGMLKPYITSKTRLLEVGCWDGKACLHYMKELDIHSDVYGIDCFEDAVNMAMEKGIKASRCNLETEKFSFKDDYFDVVIANQVFEHLKQIYMPLTEIRRVLKPNGHLLFGVPNLASLHNRFLLALGKQPTCIQMFDEHVRAFTPGALMKFLLFNDLFELVAFKGVGFYPFIPPVSNILSSVFPAASVISLFLLRKTEKKGTATWQDEVMKVVKQTIY